MTSQRERSVEGVRASSRLRGFTPYHFYNKLDTGLSDFGNKLSPRVLSTPAKSGKGFTLIELLVVVAIIGILSSVILSGLREARGKATDAAVRAQAVQLRNVLALEFSVSGSYAAIKSGGSAGGGNWYGVGSVCNVADFSGQYAQSAANVCTSLVRAAGAPCGVDGCVFFYTTNPNLDTKFSILVYMPYASKLAGDSRFLCVGSSNTQSVVADPASNSPGCWSNP
jgi:prepilin-type N-terminal cleavage/methylation domain-containing protein